MDKYLNQIKQLTNEQIEQFDKYYQILFEESQKYNLTTITSKEEVYIKHFYDSILLLKYIKLAENKRLIDIGSGAGFPGIPLKILCPQLKITLVEPTTKRAKFLELVIKELDLKDISVINDRAENYINVQREQFDYASARAVAPLNILLELLTPFVKPKGIVIALKGSSYQEELTNAGNAQKILNLALKAQYEDRLPNDLGVRDILIFEKIKTHSLEYPRHYSKIKKKPL